MRWWNATLLYSWIGVLGADSDSANEFLAVDHRSLGSALNHHQLSERSHRSDTNQWRSQTSTKRLPTSTTPSLCMLFSRLLYNRPQTRPGSHQTADH
eukprot:2100080-Pyramimonas_sp.AAC.1